MIKNDVDGTDFNVIVKTPLSIVVQQNNFFTLVKIDENSYHNELFINSMMNTNMIKL